VCALGVGEQGARPWVTWARLPELGPGPDRGEQGREKLVRALDSRGSSLLTRGRRRGGRRGKASWNFLGTMGGATLCKGGRKGEQMRRAMGS
jgi:hypothetical protein